MRTSILIAFLLFWHGLLAQEPIRLTMPRLIDPDLRVLYIGIDNIVVLENYTDTNVSLIIDKGSVYPWRWGSSGNTFGIRCTTPGPVTISIIQNTGKKTRVIDTVHYTAFRVPDPVPLFGNIRDLEITPTVASLQSGLYIFMPWYYPSPYFRIISFTMTVVYPNGTWAITSTNGDRFSPEQLQILKNLRPGDKLYFEDIKCTCPDCTIRTLTTINKWIVGR